MNQAGALESEVQRRRHWRRGGDGQVPTHVGAVTATRCALNVIVALLVVGTILAAVSCGGSASGSAVPPGWTTFEGPSVSLMLPDSFVGGDVADPAIVAVLGERAKEIPDDSFQSTLTDIWLAQAYVPDRDGNMRELVLCMLGKPDGEGLLPSVTVWRRGLRDVVARTGGDASLEAIAAYIMGLTPESEWTVNVLNPTRAHIVWRQESPPSSTPISEQTVIEVVGDYLYEFRYEHHEESNEALDADFSMSAETATANGD